MPCKKLFDLNFKLHPRNDLKECKEPSESDPGDKTSFKQAFAMMNNICLLSIKVPVSFVCLSFFFLCFPDVLKKAKMDAIQSSKQAPGGDFGFHVPESSLNDWESWWSNGDTDTASTWKGL